MFDGLSATDWNFLKIHDCTHFGDAIRHFACVTNYSCNRFEKGHRRNIKQGFQGSNKQEDSLDLQVSSQGRSASGRMLLSVAHSLHQQECSLPR